jgi:hypothetical protein
MMKENRTKMMGMMKRIGNDEKHDADDENDGG